jgi:hypothetical protein
VREFKGAILHFWNRIVFLIGIILWEKIGVVNGGKGFGIGHLGRREKLIRRLSMTKFEVVAEYRIKALVKDRRMRGGDIRKIFCFVDYL